LLQVLEGYAGDRLFHKGRRSTGKHEEDEVSLGGLGGEVQHGLARIQRRLIRDGVRGFQELAVGEGLKVGDLGDDESGGQAVGKDGFETEGHAGGGFARARDHDAIKLGEVELGVFDSKVVTSSGDVGLDEMIASDLFKGATIDFEGDFGGGGVGGGLEGHWPALPER